MADYPEKKDEAPAESIGEVKEGEIPLLIQWDERWGYIHYGDGIIANSGCGPTALAMVAAGLTGDNSITPYKIASYAGANGYYVAGSGSSWSLMTEAALNFGVAGTEIALSESSVTEELNAGHPIICSMKQGDFTTDGHFIVLTGWQTVRFRCMIQTVKNEAAVPGIMRHWNHRLRICGVLRNYNIFYAGDVTA